ncbi:gp53-like domain-containing protein [Clostridium tertium]|uniref:gp53-like domain-containing protein n=1 Tax=Clostridium tertium TaxID=1559 RepID=UPI000BE43ED3|nr:hypothetical protein [Clostridium tertium]
MGVQKIANYKVHNGTDFDEINFKTIASQVKMASGVDLESGFINTKDSTGYTKLPNGMILQWGTITDNVVTNSTNVNKSIMFPVSFPNNVLVPLPSFGAFYTDGAWESINVDSHVIDKAYDKNHFEIRYNRRDGGTRPGKYILHWFAIGY